MTRAKRPHVHRPAYDDCAVCGLTSADMCRGDLDRCHGPRRAPAVSLKVFKRQVRRERADHAWRSHPLSRVLVEYRERLLSATGYTPNVTNIPIGAALWKRACDGDHASRRLVEGLVGGSRWSALPWRSHP